MPKKIRPIRVEGNIAFVPLTRGYEAVIDADDVGIVSNWNWYAVVKRSVDGSVRTVYAARKDTISGGWPTLFLHRAIAKTPEGMETDHRDGDGLNNRRSNLRAATKSQNGCNQSRSCRNASGFKGVYWDSKSSKWQAQISLHGKCKSLGFFASKYQAAEAYAAASKEIHGEFGRADI